MVQSPRRKVQRKQDPVVFVGGYTKRPPQPKSPASVPIITQGNMTRRQLKALTPAAQRKWLRQATKQLLAVSPTKSEQCSIVHWLKRGRSPPSGGGAAGPLKRGRSSGGPAAGPSGIPASEKPPMTPPRSRPTKRGLVYTGEITRGKKANPINLATTP